MYVLALHMSWKLDFCKLSNLISLVVVFFWTSITSWSKFEPVNCAENLVLVIHKTFDTVKFTAPFLRLAIYVHVIENRSFVFSFLQGLLRTSQCFVYTCSDNLISSSQLGQSGPVRSNPFHQYEMAILVKLIPFLSIWWNIFTVPRQT